MPIPTLFVSRVNVAMSTDTALLIVSGPAGPIRTDGQIETVEVARFAMSHQTLRLVAELLANKVRELPTPIIVEPAKDPAPLARSFTKDEKAKDVDPELEPQFTTH